MPRIVEFQTTPNPNALKCLLDGPLPPAPVALRSFRALADAAGDPLARSLMAIPGVTGVLLADRWLTVNKSADTSWSPIKKAVERAVGAAGGSAGGAGAA